MPRNLTAQQRIATAPSTTDPTTEKSKLARQVEIIKKLREHERYNKIEYFDPYPYQKRFHDTGSNCNQRLLMAGNRIGKSFSGACETALHLTGLYPEWWQGKRYKQPITAWCGGVSNETVRDILQQELLGTAGDPQAVGTGAIPRANIIKTERKPGVPNAVSIVQVKHITGGKSYLYFKAYEMGPEKWYGRSVDFVWLDELPPSSIYSQAVTRTLDRRGMVAMTYTPEAGFDLRESVAILQFKGETVEQRLERTIERTDNSFDEIMSHLIRLEEKIDHILLVNNPMDQKGAR